ncbi:DUF3718 domain-containing protein [Pseudoalteromonas translucida]|nr:DUF3718 domain-containing protein [Pseudoalteromonas translucida]
MNTLKATLYSSVLLSAVSIASPVMATQFIAADSTPGTQACMAVASNKRLTIHNTMKSLRISKAVISKKLLCNDLSVGDFISLYSLNKSARFLNIDMDTRTSITDLAKAKMPSVVIMAGSK